MLSIIFHFIKKNEAFLGKRALDTAYYCHDMNYQQPKRASFGALKAHVRYITNMLLNCRATHDMPKNFAVRGPLSMLTRQPPVQHGASAR